MRKLFLLIPALVLALASYATTPSTDFSGGYTFAADDATLDGNIELNTLTETHYLRYFDREVNGTATWEVSVTKPCLVSVTLNMIDNSWNNASDVSYKNGGHIFRVRILDGTTPKDSVEEISESTASSAYTLSGQIYFEKAGNYTVELLNRRGYSKCGLSGITLTAKSAPETSFASTYTCTAGAAELSGDILYETGGPNDPYIRYNHSWKPGTAEWTILATRACYISATVNMADNTWNYDSSDNVRKYFQNHNHIFIVELHDAHSNLLDSVQEGDHKADGTTDGWNTYPIVNLPGTIYIPEAGIYTIKLKNNRNESRCGVSNVSLAYAGGAVQEISTSANTTLNVADALFEGCTRDNAKTYIQYPSSGTASAWMKWNIATSATKMYDLTVNINTAHAHGFTVAIYEDEEADPVASVTEGSYVNTTGIRALELGRVNLVGGKNYVAKVTNAPSGSEAKVTSLVFAPVVASTIELPGTLAFNQAVLSDRAHLTNGNLYFAPIGDTNPAGEWVRWSVTTNHAGTFLFTLGVNSTNGQSYKITIKDDGDNDVDIFEKKLSSGVAANVTHYFNLAEGNYSVIVENTTAWSKGYLTSFVVTEPNDIIEIAETATDNTEWAAKVNDGNTYNVQTIRTLKGGEYNTFCVPFAVSSDLAKDVFGSDVEIYTLDEAVVESDGFVLNLTLKASSDIYQGTPVFIKPSRNIVNPVFCGVKFLRDAPAATTKTHANFVGTFVSTTLLAGQDILFLGPNNTMYYPLEDIDIDGMRAWFVIHDAPAPASAIRRARIVERENVVTEIELVGEDNNQPTNVQKILHNGQLFILRDGIRYNALGNRVQ